MGIKETPTNFRVYYNKMKQDYKEELQILEKQMDDIVNEINSLYKSITDNIEIYKNNFDIDLNTYNEFIINQYTTGDLFKVAKGLFINRKNNYALVSDLYDLYRYASKQKELSELKYKYDLLYKLTNLSLKDYTEILRLYYTEVHKKLILEGNGYAFGENIGWICINRCVLKNNKKMLDFAATKKREQELKSAGERIYNKDEAEWCAKRGIQYTAADKRVYKDNEYCYEIPLIGCKLQNGDLLKLTITDYRHTSLRGKSNNDIIELAHNDTKEICNLSLDIKTKLTLCDQVDKILYTKFIRNETQESIAFRKANRKNR